MAVSAGTNKAASATGPGTGGGAKKRSRRKDAEPASPAFLSIERVLWDLGLVHVAGVDEVGLGPLAGPVVAAAVVLPQGHEPIAVADSKKLSAARREEADEAIRERATAFAVGEVSVVELDAMGVHKAGLEAMRRAVTGLADTLGGDPDYLLVDARTVPDLTIRQQGFVKADAFIYSVAAASIVAKVRRDAQMTAYEEQYPGYGFGRHMGYGTAAHLEALDELGPCPIHRRSFEPVRKRLG